MFSRFQSANNDPFATLTNFEAWVPPPTNKPPPPLPQHSQFVNDHRQVVSKTVFTLLLSYLSLPKNTYVCKLGF